MKIRKETEFYEIETRKMKLNILIGAIAVVTLLLTGTFFAAMSSTDAGADLKTTEAYQTASYTE